MLQHFEQGCARLQPLLSLHVEAACDDPTALLLTKLILPLLQERLEALAEASLVTKFAVWPFETLFQSV